MIEKTLARVVECVAQVTRYPKQLLSVDADLENDLGIDSVKRVEILASFSDEFGVPLHTEERDPSVRTIGDVARWIDGLLTQNDLHQYKQPRGTSQLPVERAHRALEGSEGQGAVDRYVSPAHAPTQPHYPSTLAGEGESVSPSLVGRVAMVTGAGRGIGRTIARLLASRGATLVVNSFHSREQGEATVADIESQGGSAYHVWGSVANSDHVDQMFADIEQRSGHLDILVCNASDGRIGPFLELTPDDWDRAFRTNVSGHYACALRAARLMKHRGGGSIVTMSAVGAHQYVEGLGSQGVIKAAVESLTRYLSCELGRFGIRVNCVAGGPVYGELLEKFPEARIRQNTWERLAPDRELCNPMDLARTVAFLVSDEARGINGAIWTVDHGFSAASNGQPLWSTS